MTALQTVLLVDDEPDILTVSRIALETVGGLTVMTAESGEAALERLKSIRPDAILLDMMMPGMDGLDTLHSVRERYAEAAPPVVFMTAKTQQSEIDEYLQAGAVGVIRKPFDPMELPALLRAAVDGETAS